LKKYILLLVIGCQTNQIATLPQVQEVQTSTKVIKPNHIQTIQNPASSYQSSCRKSDGSWACPSLKVPLALSASAIPPVSWTVPFWAIDPQNNSGCANDSNTGISTTCGSPGSGPLLTYTQIVQRWGTLCPSISNVVQIEFISGQTANTDAIQACAFTKNPAYLEIFSPAQSSCTSTLSNLTAKNRTSGQLLQAQAGSCFTGEDLMVTNTTHPAVAWTNKLVSGNIYSLTEPANNTSYVSVDTWANGDSVIIGTPPQVNIRSIRSDGSACQLGDCFNIWIHDITMWAPDGNLDTITSLAGNLYIDEVRVQGGEWYTQLSLFTECDNCDFMSGTEINIPGAHNEIGSGQIWGVHKNGINKFGNAPIGGDIILFNQNAISGAQVGSVYLASGATLLANADSNITANFEGLPTGPAMIWGSGTVISSGSSKVTYPTPATSVFLNSGGLQFDASSVVGCALDTGVDPALWHCGRSLTPTLLNTSIAAGGFNDCAMSAHGARFCVQ
jgi:hypothetical protein